MPSLHAVPELARHMSCHQYMQVWSVWGRYHAILKCNFWACGAYAMPSTISPYWFALVCITLYCFISYCPLSLISPMSPKPWCLQDIGHILIICSPGAWLCICYVLITCSSGACNTYAMPPLHAVSELGAHMPYPHYMQFWSLYSICHATIICSSRMCRAYAMPSLNAISELVIYMQCPQLLLCIALYCFVLCCIALYCVALWAL